MTAQSSSSQRVSSRCLALRLAGMSRPVALTLALVLLAGILSSPAVSSSPTLVSNNPPTYNNLDTLIADIFDEADDRLKKSKMNGARQVKQTLRFGRRSDPWLAPSSPDQVTLEELQNRLYGINN